MAEPFDERVGVPVALRALGEQHHGRGWSERRGKAEVGADELDAVGEADLERDERVQVMAEPRADGQRALQVVDGEQCDDPVGKVRHEAKVHTGDDGERAFTPGQHAGPVVSGVVLAQCRDPADDASRRRVRPRRR